MINIKKKTCAEKNCETIPCFNFKGEKDGLYCTKHKKDKMIDVKHKICMEKKCERRAFFNIISNKKIIMN